MGTKGERYGNWLPLLLALTTAVNGFLAVGVLAQSTQIATSVLKRLGDTLNSALGRTYPG